MAELVKSVYAVKNCHIEYLKTDFKFKHKCNKKRTFSVILPPVRTITFPYPAHAATSSADVPPQHISAHCQHLLTVGTTSANGMLAILEKACAHAGSKVAEDGAVREEYSSLI